MPLVVDGVTDVPFTKDTRACHAWNEMSVHAVEVEDHTGRTRGTVAIALSKTGRSDGVVAYHEVEHAETLIGLIQSAIDDARRIDRGEAPIAPRFDGTFERRDN